MARFDPFGSNFEHPFVNSSPDYAPRYASFRARPIGDTSPALAPKGTYRERRDRLRDVENEKNQLLDDLLSQLETTQNELAQIRLIRSQETNTSGNVKDLEEQLKQIEEIVNRDPYITILIDGNHVSFTQSLLKQGEVGGKIAAERLHRALITFASQQMPEVKTVKLQLRMYCNLKSLAHNLMKTQALESADILEDFTRGFNGTDHLFDLIDAGSQEGNTQKKLCDQLRLDLFNCHCRHIIVGGFQGESYAKVLRDILETSNALARLTILACASLQADTSTPTLPFPIIKFNDILCEPYSAPSPKSSAGTLCVAAPVLARIESSSTASLRTPPASTSSTPQMTWAGLAAQPTMATGIPKTTKTAAVVASAVPLPLTVPTARTIRNAIEYNRSGQRVDKLDSTIPYHEITRIKKMKLCNTHYLQGSGTCTVVNCSHGHNYEITNFERKVLREVARMTPCYYKLECDDPECIYGHRCPQSKPGDDGCYYGEDCRFWGWGHGIDTKIVKTTKV